MGFGIRPQTSSATGGKLKPYLISLSEIELPISSTGYVLEITGDNFDTDTVFEVLNNTGNNVQITSTSIRTPQLAQLVLTIGRTQAFYGIACNNSANDHFHKSLSFSTKNITILTPALNGVVWQNISAGINTSLGTIETNNSTSSWNKQGTFGVLPANTDGKLSFVYAGVGSNGTSTSYGMMGLGIDPASNTSYNTIDHALYISNSTGLNIYENGASRGAQGGGSAVGDLFEIKRTGTVITYYKNGNLIYTSNVASTGALHFDCSLYRNIKLTDLKIIY